MTPKQQPLKLEPRKPPIPRGENDPTFVPKSRMRQQVAVSSHLLGWIQRSPSARVAAHRDRYPTPPVAPDDDDPEVADVDV